MLLPTALAALLVAAPPDGHTLVPYDAARVTLDTHYILSRVYGPETGSVLHRVQIDPYGVKTELLGRLAGPSHDFLADTVWVEDRQGHAAAEGCVLVRDNGVVDVIRRPRQDLPAYIESLPLIEVHPNARVLALRSRDAGLVGVARLGVASPGAPEGPRAGFLRIDWLDGEPTIQRLPGLAATEFLDWTLNHGWGTENTSSAHFQVMVQCPGGSLRVSTLLADGESTAFVDWAGGEQRPHVDGLVGPCAEGLVVSSSSRQRVWLRPWSVEAEWAALASFDFPAKRRIVLGQPTGAGRLFGLEPTSDGRTYLAAFEEGEDQLFFFHYRIPLEACSGSTEPAGAIGTGHNGTTPIRASGRSSRGRWSAGLAICGRGQSFARPADGGVPIEVFGRWDDEEDGHIEYSASLHLERPLEDVAVLEACDEANDPK